MVQVFLNDGGGDELAIAHRLIILIIVRLVGFLKLLPKFNEESGDVFGEIGIDFIAKKPLNDAIVVGDDLM